MDFNKPSTCKKITKFLMDNLKTETEKESLANIITGKSVLKGDAINLLFTSPSYDNCGSVEHGRL